MTELRNELGASLEVAPYMVASNRALLDMAKYRPSTLESLTKIEEFTEAMAKKYGGTMLEWIKDYCAKNQLEMDLFDGEERQVQYLLSIIEYSPLDQYSPEVPKSANFSLWSIF